MNFKRMLPVWAMTFLGRTYMILMTPLNLIWFYAFHAKFRFDPDQKTLWENRIEEDFAQLGAIEENRYYRKLDRIIFKQLSQCRANLYLEIGCYFGYRLNKFAKQAKNKRFVGLELGINNLLFGKKKTVDCPNIELVNADAAALPFRDGSVETVFTVVSLTHIKYESIENVIDEIVRVCSGKAIFVEVDQRPMRILKKFSVINWNAGYLHPYEKIVGDRMKLVRIDPIADEQNHPRYSLFEFIK